MILERTKNKWVFSIRNIFVLKEVFALYHKADCMVIGSLGLHTSWANEDDRYKDLKVKEIGSKKTTNQGA